MSVLSDFPQVGDVFLGRYQIESILGSGGFARVYRAMQTDLDRAVAIKVMRPSLETDESTEETLAQIEKIEQRFRREARVISKFRSPTTVVVHDYGRTDGGLLFMTLEYVDGQTLSQLIKEQAPLPPKRAVAISRQVLESLHEAHAFDILHRDIKPQNIMVFSHLDQTDLVKVLDFGIAKILDVEEEAVAVQELTTDGTLVGTPRYMSPEQIRGDKLTPASDIYSLGLVLFEALTATKAVAETTTMRIIAAHLDPRPIAFPADIALGDGLRAIVSGMIAKEPSDRFGSAREVLKALDSWNSDEALTFPRPADARPADLSEMGMESDQTEITGPGARDDSGALPLDRDVLEPLQPEIEPSFEEGELPAIPVVNTGVADVDTFADLVDEADSRAIPVIPIVSVVFVLLVLIAIVAFNSGSDPVDESQANTNGLIVTRGSHDSGLAAAQDTGAENSDPARELQAGETNNAAVAEKPSTRGGTPNDNLEVAVDTDSVVEPADPEEETGETTGSAEPASQSPKPKPKPKPPKKPTRKFFSVERTK